MLISIRQTHTTNSKTISNMNIRSSKNSKYEGCNQIENCRQFFFNFKNKISCALMLHTEDITSISSEQTFCLSCNKRARLAMYSTWIKLYIQKNLPWAAIQQKDQKVDFPLVSWVRCGTWLYRLLISAPLLTFKSDYRVMLGAFCNPFDLH